MPGLSERERKILSKVFAAQFEGSKSQFDYLTRELQVGKSELIDELSSLERKELVSRGKNKKITKAGRKAITVVMAGGTFDILHPGHLETLELARALGDVLIVSVARDATFRRNKGRDPLHNENLRRNLVSALKMVDAAVLGSEHEILGTATKISPDVIALGYDQSHDGNEIKEQLARRGIEVKIIRLKSSVPGIKTRRILETFRSMYSF